jgi:hypothetical protein
VEVRPAAEILETLDHDGRLDGVPFMPEMLRYVGRRFRVSRRVEKICDTITVAGNRPSSRRMEGNVSSRTSAAMGRSTVAHRRRVDPRLERHRARQPQRGGIRDAPDVLNRSAAALASVPCSARRGSGQRLVASALDHETTGHSAVRRSAISCRLRRRCTLDERRQPRLQQQDRKHKPGSVFAWLSAVVSEEPLDRRPIEEVTVRRVSSAEPIGPRSVELCVKPNLECRAEGPDLPLENRLSWEEPRAPGLSDSLCSQGLT